MVIEVQRHLFTVEEFARMGETGILTEDDRVELIDGEIREMPPIVSPHAGMVDRLNERLMARLLGKVNVRIQNPVKLSEFTEPQPDLTVLRRREDHYTGRHPEADDILLVIEVADSSLLYDRVEKMPRYAKAGIPEAWLVDVVAGEVTVYTGPSPDGYSDEQVLRQGEEITSTGVSELRLAIDEIFS